MDTNAKRYLELISQHLQEHHAALFVGAGFSLNADKVTSDVPDIPLWAGLAQKFKEKLGDSDQNDPLALAESVEIAYGRSELDHLLLDSIKDADYRPSPLYEKLLRLPWSDVFTTNYDTLLERAGENLVEKTFTLVTNKNDLVGSSGATRLIKLHGSFPSQRPFIITAEDYRTYPQKFAPFVNTVQQSLLENTLCMIGFSGNDPNFNNWIGWIRDNLGAENAPYLYLLSHWANTFATRTARILLTTLSELCSKCSDKMMAQLLVFLKKLYDSPQKEHYLKAAPLVRRLISFYPVALRHDLVMQLLTFPLPDLKRLNVQLDFPDPFEVLSASASGYESNSDRSYKEVEQLIALIQRNDEDLSALNRLLYCGAHGLLTTEQKKWLGGFIWKNGEPHLPPYWLDTVCLKLPSQYEVEEVRYLCQSITNKIAQNTSGAIRFPGGDAVFTELINVSLPHADDFTPEETSAILEYSNKRITALSENINREVDIFGDKGMFVSQIYQILHALWIFTTLRSQWTPTEKDCAVMLAIITQCDSHHISHHGIKRYWSIFLKQNFESKKDLEHSLRSADTKRAHSCYNVLATTICNPDKRLLPDDELCIGLGVAAQQIAWGVPKQLVSALQTVSHAVQYRSDLLTMQSMELILTGLSQLVEQTRISSDDTVATASEKGDIRRWAVILATKIDAGKISKDGQEILKDWRAVSQDKDEFVEIRNGQR